jgi:hypothetical protein
MSSRMLDWMASTTWRSDNELTPQQQLEGMELICAVSFLQSTMLALRLELGDTSTPRCQEGPLYCQWILIGISQLLRNASWKLLDCSLPTMTEDNVYENALATLKSLGTITGQAGMGVAAFLPIVFSMVLEMRSYEERQQVLRLLDSCRLRCPELCEHFCMYLSFYAWS